MDETDNRDAEEKSSWWYWFKKLDGNMAECNNCDWVKDRGPGFLRKKNKFKRTIIQRDPQAFSEAICVPNTKNFSWRKLRLTN